MKKQDLLKLIKRRKSSRGLFDGNRSVKPAVLQEILEAATWAPTAHNMQNFKIVAIDNKSVLKKLSELKYAISPTFLKENYPQLSFTEAELKKRKTGILAKRFPPSWLTTEAQKGKLKQIPSKLGRQVSDESVLLLILYDPKRRAPDSKNDFLGVMSLGFMLENIWLMSTLHGVSIHIMSLFGNEPVKSEVKKMLNIPPSLDIALGCRLGYSSDDERMLRVRRDIKDFVSFNKYE